MHRHRLLSSRPLPLPEEAFEAPEDEALRERRLRHLWEDPPGLRGWFGTVDHKKIGIRYLVTAFVFLVAGGLEAVLMRLQLSRPDNALLGPEAYNQIFSLHGITMIFWYASPILSGFGNYLMPLVLGARDMAFPRLNAFSYWSFALSGLFLYASVPLGAAPDAGWFAYAPLTLPRYSPGPNLDFYALSLLFLTISTTAGAINFVVTILRLRAVGMALWRMPLMAWSTLTTSVLIVVSLPALTAALVMLELDRQWGTRFFQASLGGDPLLWQHTFWFFGHPWVYVVFLPATGMISMLLPVFARRPIVAYPWVATSTVLTGVVGMSVWVHHMFATEGVSHGAMSFFSAASMTLSVFSTIQVFAWLATLWLGRPVRSTALLFALGFIATFVVGGLTGVVSAVIPFDWQITDTYFIVAHLHYVLIGANLFPVFAAFYYWLPKITGRMLDERLGRWSFWLAFIGFHVGFFPMHLSGLLGMRRRVYTYLASDGLGTLNLVTTIGAFTLALGILLSLINLFVSLRRGRVAGSNPWSADSLEWALDSPPESYGSVHLPKVDSRHPLWSTTSPDEDPLDERVFDGGRWTLGTTVLRAEPRGVAQMPDDTLAPLWMALALTVLFVALFATSLPAIAAATVLCLAAAAFWAWPRAEVRG